LVLQHQRVQLIQLHPVYPACRVYLLHPAVPSDLDHLAVLLHLSMPQHRPVLSHRYSPSRHKHQLHRSMLPNLQHPLVPSDHLPALLAQQDRSGQYLSDPTVQADQCIPCCPLALYCLTARECLSVLCCQAVQSRQCRCLSVLRVPDHQEDQPHRLVLLVLTDRWHLLSSQTPAHLAAQSDQHDLSVLLRQSLMPNHQDP
jgi:hypothetical protein